MSIRWPDHLIVVCNHVFLLCLTCCCFTPSQPHHTFFHFLSSLSFRGIHIMRLNHPWLKPCRIQPPHPAIPSFFFPFCTGSIAGHGSAEAYTVREVQDYSRRSCLWFAERRVRTVFWPVGPAYECHPGTDGPSNPGNEYDQMTSRTSRLWIRPSHQYAYKLQPQTGRRAG